MRQPFCADLVRREVWPLRFTNLELDWIFTVRGFGIGGIQAPIQEGLPALDKVIQGWDCIL